MVLCWSLNFIIGKITLRHIDVFTLTPFRIILAGLILLLVYFTTPGRKRFHRQDFWTFFALGLFGVAMNQGFFTLGLNYTTAGHSSLIIAVSPILVLLIAWAMNQEALTAPKMLGMVVSFVGVTLLATEQGLHLRSGNLLGDLITVGGDIGFAIYAVVGKKVAKRYDSLSMNTFNTLAASILLLPLAIRQGARLDWGAVGWVGWAGMFYMAAFSSVVGYLIFYWALRYMAASRLSAFSYIQPVVVNILGIALLGEHLTARLLAGGALILFGVYVTERKFGEKNNESEGVAA
jgi:drug/metabolite transporter (DMT)-like permease